MSKSWQQTENTYSIAFNDAFRKPTLENFLLLKVTHCFLMFPFNLDRQEMHVYMYVWGNSNFQI